MCQHVHALVRLEFVSKRFNFPLPELVGARQHRESLFCKLLNFLGRDRFEPLLPIRVFLKMGGLILEFMHRSSICRFLILLEELRGYLFALVASRLSIHDLSDDLRLALPQPHLLAIDLMLMSFLSLGSSEVRIRLGALLVLALLLNGVSLDHRSGALFQPVVLLLTDLGFVLDLLLRHEGLVAGEVSSQIRVRGVILCSEALHFIGVIVMLDQPN